MLFSRSGPLSRLVLPSTRTLALVEFLEPGDARSAFKVNSHGECFEGNMQAAIMSKISHCHNNLVRAAP